ncbi:ATP-dependent DNA helicase pif1-like [Helianthus annuus]|uniref:ATP-dependent DNA helicase pif1-like n=1 Tax=Helianthus annuus TaxID=4232 RepID=UPI001652E897|nr:ATP-dependent DNA helicase pif1-like [Helianthus annuus]
MTAVGGGKGGVFFLYGYDGTGKTYLWKTLAASIRCNGDIVVIVASSGIASLLLSRGRTAHSRFHIPINLNEDSVCHIKPNSEIANLLNEAKLIIWDEAPMVHKHAFEALDRTLKDVLSVSNSRNFELPFGGKTIVFGGDFRQILPVVQNGSRQDIVHASLCSSYIWSTCKVLKLTRNMRLSVGSSSSNIDEINDFAKWLLEIGEGNLGDGNDGESTIEIPNDLLITDSTDPIQSLIDFVYPSVLHRFKDRDYFSERAILAPKNEVVHGINDRLLALFPGEEVEYLSSDSLCPTEEINDPLHQDLYNPDVLNSVIISGLPNHRLVLKLGVPVMLLRNIDQQNGLCNGTRLQITRLRKRVIEAEILSGDMDQKRSSCSFLKLVDAHHPTKVLMADKFWGQFYGSSYKGGSTTLYLGERFWNVKMEALSDKCAFTDGWSKLIRDLELDSRTTFIFTMAGYETFELSVFNHETGTQMYFKKVDVVVLDDPIYRDDGFDLLLAVSVIMLTIYFFIISSN